MSTALLVEKDGWINFGNSKNWGLSRLKLSFDTLKPYYTRFPAGLQNMALPTDHYDLERLEGTSYGGQQVNHFHQTSDGMIWMATTSGLIAFDSNNESFVRYGQENGFKDEMLHAILEDDQGDLWISTNDGIHESVVRIGV